MTKYDKKDSKSGIQIKQLCKNCLIIRNQIKEQIIKWGTFGACQLKVLL